MTRGPSARVLLLVSIAAAATASAQTAPRSAAFFDRLRKGADVPWLEQLAASGEFLLQEWRSEVGGESVSPELRVEAYARLGALGTTESLEAIKRVDVRLGQQRTLAAPSASAGWWPTPAASFGGSNTLGPTETVGVGAREYAVRVLELYGPFAPYLSWRDRGAQSWSRPILVAEPIPESWSFLPHLDLRAEGLTLSLVRRPQMSPSVAVPEPVVLNPDLVHRDTDRDGWTDYEERRLGLNPALADSDADGVGDGADASPLYAPRADDAADDDLHVLRRAWLAMYGVRGSRYAHFVTSGGRPMQLVGLAGPVFFGVDLPSRSGCGRGARRDACAPVRGGAQISWQLGRLTDGDAIVSFVNHLGSGFKSSVRLRLRRISGEWIVVEYALTGLT